MEANGRPFNCLYRIYEAFRSRCLSKSLYPIFMVIKKNPLQILCKVISQSFPGNFKVIASGRPLQGHSAVIRINPKIIISRLVPGLNVIVPRSILIFPENHVKVISGSSQGSFQNHPKGHAN